MDRALGGTAQADPRPVSRDTVRSVAFSDAVFAISITLLVLEITPPADHRNLLHGLLALWPSYLAYAVTFLFIGQVWVNHHVMFDHIRAANRVVLLLNTLLLMVVAFLPGGDSHQQAVPARPCLACGRRAARHLAPRPGCGRGCRVQRLLLASNPRRSPDVTLARRQAAPRVTQAFAETTNGGSGSLSLQSSRNAVR